MKPTNTLIIRFMATSLLLSSLSVAANAQSNIIPKRDSSFNNSGWIQLKDYYSFIPQAMAIRPNGKILTSGYGKTSGASDEDGIVYCITADGTPDPEFGTNGHVLLDVDGTHDAVYGIHALPDDKTLILLHSFNRILLVRLLADGSYDEDFGNGGFSLVLEDAASFANTMTVQPDGKILLIGERVKQGILSGVVWRLHPDGTPDDSFGGGGSVSVSLDASKNLSLNAGVVQPDGKIVLTGSYGSGSTAAFPIIRLNTDGSYDNTFSGDGKYSKVLGTAARTAEARAIALDANGNIYVSGSGATTTETAMTVISVTPAGLSNSGFGNFGTAKIVISPYATANKIVFQPDGKILLGGFCYVSTERTYFALVRLNPNGSLDPTFGLPTTPGRYLSSFNEPAFLVEVITGLGLTADGRLVMQCWMSQSVANQEPAKAALMRHLLDIVVASSEPSPVLHPIAVFPSPARSGDRMTLKYELDESRAISLSIFNMNGDRLADLLSNEYRAAGQHREQFALSPEWPAGAYLALLVTDDGIRTMKFVKMD